MLSNEDVARSKPDPEIYLSAMKRLGVTPAQTLVVEDAPHGLEAARRAGAHLCRVAGYTEVDYWRIRASLEAAERPAGLEC